MSSSSGFDVNKEIAELEAKLKELEEDLKKPGVSEAERISINNKIAAVDSKIAPLYAAAVASHQQQSQGQQATSSSAATCAAGGGGPSSFSSLLFQVPSLLSNFNPETFAVYQALLVRYGFLPGIKVFGTVDAESDIYSHSTIFKELKKKGCIVCGVKDQVTQAHILPSKAACKSVGVPWDDSNFLPLCGTGWMDQDNNFFSCHSAFDRNLLCFVRDEEEPDKHIWTIMASDENYKQFNGKQVDLSAIQPHRRSLHAHALHCVSTFQVKPIPQHVLQYLKETIPPTPPSVCC